MIADVSWKQTGHPGYTYSIRPSETDRFHEEKNPIKIHYSQGEVYLRHDARVWLMGDVNRDVQQSMNKTIG